MYLQVFTNIKTGLCFVSQFDQQFQQNKQQATRSVSEIDLCFAAQFEKQFSKTA